MASRGFITIPDWMYDLDLDVYETIILATIFGFSQDGDSRFSGSQNYLARKAKCSRRKVVNCLENLLSKGFIEKFDVNVRGIHLCEYTFKASAFDAQGVHQVHRGCECGAHNNIDDNIDINNTLSNKGKAKFQKPSLEEIRLYCQERNNSVEPEKFFNFYESKGWVVGKSPMKDWKAAVRTWEQRRPDWKAVVRTWEQRRPETTRTTFSSRQKKSVFEQNLEVMDQMFGTDMHSKAYGKNEVYDEQ